MPERRVDALTIVIDTDTGPVRLAAAEVEAYLSAIRDERVNIDIDVDASKVLALNKAMKGAKSDLAALERELERTNKGLHRNSNLYKKLDPLTRMFIDNNWDAIKSLKANEKGVQKLTPAVRDLSQAQKALAGTVLNVTERQKAAADTSNRAAKATRAQEKAAADLEKQVERTDAAYRKDIATQQRARQENEKFDLEMSKLVQRHAELQDQMAKTAGRSAFLKTPQDIAKLERLRTEMAYVREQFRRMGGDMSMLDGHSERNQNSLAGLVDQLSRVRLHLGFFSLNVKQAAYALTAFGPIISGIIGAASSLVGVLGSGLVAALGLAGAAMGGFALSAVGIGFALQPLIKEFTTATDAATKYYEQVLKTGKGSSEAQDKLEAYNTVLKNLPPETRAAVVEFGKMRASWMKVTEELRKPFFNLMTDGMSALNSLMPMFQRNTERAFGVASKGVRQWISGLRGPEAKTIMDTLMNRMISATPALMSGIGNVATALGRLSQAASRALPGVMQNFDKWTQGLTSRTSANGFALQMNQMMDSLRSIGRLTSSAGRLLVTFFSAGSDAGKSFTDQITKTFNRWNTWMKSVAGQRSLKTFFSESITEMGSLYDILSPIIKTFARFVKTMRPVSMAFQRITAAGLELLNVIMQIPGVAHLVAAALTAKMLLGIAGTVKSLAFAFGALRVKLLGASAASAAFSTSMAQLKVAATGAASSALPGVGKQATVAASGMTRLAMAGRGIMGIFGGPWGLALTAATIGLTLFGDDLAKAAQGSRSLEEILVDQQEALRNNELASAAAANSVKTFNARLREAEASAIAYNKAVKQGASQEELDKLFNRTSEATKSADKSLEAYAQNLLNYQQSNATLRKSNQEAAQSFLEMEDLSQSFLDKFVAGLSGAGGGAQGITNLTDLSKQFKAEIMSGSVGVDEFVRRVRAMPGLEKFEISPEGRKALHDLRMWKISDDLRNLNFNRMGMGLQRLPSRIAGPLNELGRTLPTAKFKQFKGVLSSIESPRAAQQVVLLSRELQKIKGARGAPVGASLMERIIGKMDPNKPQQTVQRMIAGIKRLTGRAPQLKLGVTKDSLATTQQKIKNIQSQIAKGFTGRMQINNLINSQNKLRDIIKRLGEIDAKNPHVKVSIDPVYTGNWTKQVTIEPKAKGGLTWPFAQGGDTNRAKEERSVTRGGRYAAPTFLVGEERRPEFVIATNPAYRKNNVQYWMEAGAALGVPGFAGGWSPVNENKPHTAPLTRPPFKVKAKGYGQLKELIQWSQAETERSRAFYENEVNAGRLGSIPYDLIGKDLLRTKALTENLRTSTNKRIDALQKKKKKQDDILKSSKSSKKDKEKAKDKKKDIIAKIKELKKELRLDLPQALSDIQTEIDTNATDQATEGGGQTIAQGAVALSAARYGLYKDFGANTISAGALGGLSFGSTPAVNFAGDTLPAPPPSANPTVGGGARSAAAGRGQVVNVTNNYQEPPADPHTWSKSLQWELGTV